MRTEQNAVLGSLRRAQQFLTVHGEVVTAVTPASRKQLDDLVAQLGELAIAQDTGARESKGGTSRQSALSLTLRRTYMAPVAEVAKLLLRNVPEFSALKLPSPDANAEATVIAAYAMASAAAAHAQTLIDNGLQPTFVADLRAAAAGVSESLTDRTLSQGRRTGATAGLIAGEKRGRGLLRVLNVVIRGQIGADAQLLAEWTAAKRVRRKPGPAVGSQSGAHASDPVPVHPVVVVTSTPASPPMAVAA